MTYHLETARAIIDERMREAEQHRLARAVYAKNRAETKTRRARLLLARLGA
ncbi:hypothetical protein [Kitasatospora purpeofusca]|uniref:hypothetical protein n=1 Tax=Kitasatospora purpeofusca TaxID=67352 RepID=UPI002A5AA93D|nr:hypothetical protein [Kitasatospora purpeofusca]MDY0816788.1 hypothetical protein [Kitasatospora purpeofusca]